MTSDERYLGPHISFIEEWSQFAGGCNWYAFRPIHVEFEWDRIMGGVETAVIFMGFGIRVRYNYAETPELAEIKRRAAEIIDGGKDA